MINLKFGLQKRQWLLLLLLLAFPLLLNVMAIWMEIGTKGTWYLLTGTYQPHDPNLPIASFLAILKGLLFNILILGFISWVVIFISNKSFFQKQWPSIKLIEMATVVIFITIAFGVVTGILMPLTWLTEFNDYLLGLPISDFATKWTSWFILPETALVLSITIFLSRRNNKMVKES